MTVNIETEARRFWRENAFYKICCNNDNCEIAMDYDEGRTYIDMVGHNYIVTIHRMEGNPKDAWDSEGILSQKEKEFWTKVAEIYQTIPSWMFDFDETSECRCEISTIVQQGCQCGGI